MTTVTAYLRKEVIVDLHATIREQLREMCGWADEEIIAYDVRYRFLILVAIVYLIPISILKQKSGQIVVKDCQLGSKNSEKSITSISKIFRQDRNKLHKISKCKNLQILFLFSPFVLTSKIHKILHYKMKFCLLVNYVII